MKIKTILIALLLVLFVNLVSCTPIVNITINPTFNEGELIKFSYTIISQENEKIDYLPNINCIFSSEALLILKEANLTSNVVLYEEYTYGFVDKNMNSGICTASVSILEPYNLEFKENFEIIKSSKLSLTISLCKIEDCNSKTRVFEKGEEVYLDYTSPIESISLEGTLTLPDLSTKQLTLPTSISLEEIGAYTLEIKATKEGYQEINLKEEFSVIKKDAKIDYSKIGKANNNLIKYLIYVCILIFVILIIYFLLRRYKSKQVN